MAERLVLHEGLRLHATGFVARFNQGLLRLDRSNPHRSESRYPSHILKIAQRNEIVPVLKGRPGRMICVLSGTKISKLCD